MSDGTSMAAGTPIGDAYNRVISNSARAGALVNTNEMPSDAEADAVKDRSAAMLADYGLTRANVDEFGEFMCSAFASAVRSNAPIVDIVQSLCVSALLTGVELAKDPRDDLSTDARDRLR